MKVLGIIFLVVIAFVALANMGGSDDSKAAPARQRQPVSWSAELVRGSADAKLHSTTIASDVGRRSQQAVAPLLGACDDRLIGS